MTDTIAAIATGNVKSAIGVVRISGPDAITSIARLFNAFCGTNMSCAEERKQYYGKFTDKEGRLLDVCLCVIMRAPKSYTGENTAEIYSHGSVVVISEILNALISIGLRMAMPGEFTKRAFLAGKIDLTQAEATVDLIDAQTASAANNAVRQLSGAVSKKLMSINRALTDIMVHFHAVVDYPDEEIDEFVIQNYVSTLTDIECKLRHMADTFARGRVLVEGIPTAIVGRPNTGKSSLLNAILGYERAIVTEVAGTTRDTIEEKVQFGGVLLRLVDTAGLQNTSDIVEQRGIERTRAALSSAGLIILVFDGSQPLNRKDYDIFDLLPEETPYIIVINKCDLPLKIEQSELETLGVSACTISALTGEGIDLLEESIKEMFPFFSEEPAGELITNARQADAIGRARNSVGNAMTALTESVTADAILTDIESAVLAIGEVTGETMREDIISGIFERFCVGK